MKSFFIAIWTRIKGVVAEVEAKVIAVWKWSWALVETAYASAQKLIINLGEVHAAILLALAWLVYLMFARGLVTLSADVVAGLVKGIPYLVIAVLAAITVILVVDIINKKKQ